MGKKTKAKSASKSGAAGAAPASAASDAETVVEVAALPTAAPSSTTAVDDDGSEEPCAGELLQRLIAYPGADVAKLCTVVRALGRDAALWQDGAGNMALHLVCCFRADASAALLGACASTSSTSRRLPLIGSDSHTEFYTSSLGAYIDAAPEAAAHKNKHGAMPLHILCRYHDDGGDGGGDVDGGDCGDDASPSFGASLRRLLAAHPAAASHASHGGASPLQLLFSRSEPPRRAPPPPDALVAQLVRARAATVGDCGDAADHRADGGGGRGGGGGGGVPTLACGESLATATRRRADEAALVASWPRLASRLRAFRSVVTEEGETLAAADTPPVAAGPGALTYGEVRGGGGGGGRRVE